MQPLIVLVADPQVDLSPLTQKLWAERIVHRVVFNDDGKQCVLLGNEADLARVQYWVEQWQQGDIVQQSAATPSRLSVAQLLSLLIQTPLSALFLLTLIGFFVWMSLDSTWTDWLAQTLYAYGGGWNGIVQGFHEEGLWVLWRPVFLHFSLAHLIFNGLWWWILAPNIERLEGALALLILTVLCGFAGNLAQWGYSGPTFGGASGIAFGLLGFVGMRLKQVNYQFPALVLPIMVGLMVLSIAADVAIPNLTGTAHAAHLGGLLMGLLLGKLYPIPRA